jgi:hypothetical protein
MLSPDILKRLLSENIMVITDTQKGSNEIGSSTLTHKKIEKKSLKGYRAIKMHVSRLLGVIQ